MYVDWITIAQTELGNGRGFGSPFVRRLHITSEAARVHIAARRRGGVNPDNLAAMIPLAAPIALAVFAVLAWRYETRSWRAYEATLSPAEKRQFRAFRRIHPSKWRAFIALQQAERVARTRPYLPIAPFVEHRPASRKRPTASVL